LAGNIDIVVRRWTDCKLPRSVKPQGGPSGDEEREDAMERPDVGGRVRWWITAVFVAGLVLLALHYGLRII
jgi:hypothetical protein